MRQLKIRPEEVCLCSTSSTDKFLCHVSLVFIFPFSCILSKTFCLIIIMSILYYLYMYSSLSIFRDLFSTCLSINFSRFYCYVLITSIRLGSAPEKTWKLAKRKDHFLQHASLSSMCSTM